MPGSTTPAPRPDPRTLERYGELEAAAEARRRAKMRRQPLYLIAIVNALVIAIGVVSSIDLRRLATPGGVALRWTQAALLGDCGDYTDFSVAVTPDGRARAELCRDLSSRTAQDRIHSGQIGLRLARVVERGDAARVEIVVTRNAVPTRVHVTLTRRSGDWLVLRDGDTCSSVGCA